MSYLSVFLSLAVVSHSPPRPWVTYHCPSCNLPLVSCIIFKNDDINDNIGTWLGQALSKLPSALRHVGALDSDHFPASCAFSIAANGKLPISKSAFVDIHLWLFPMANDCDLTSHCSDFCLLLGHWSGPIWSPVPVLMNLKLTGPSPWPKHYSKMFVISCPWVLAFFTFLAMGNQRSKIINLTSGLGGLYRFWNLCLTYKFLILSAFALTNCLHTP